MANSSIGKDVIIVTGGGSGGHVTPVLAVAAELKKRPNPPYIVYIGQKNDHWQEVPAQDPNIDAVYAVRAGKFRRYHGEGWHQILDIPTQLKNIRDMFWIIIGLWQSYSLIRRLRPKVIFTRGSFVSVPVALAGKLNDVPYITHDSDSVPSLANRILSRWAWMHAVALPPEVYPYPPAKIRVVGVPVSHQYQMTTPRVMRHYRKLLHLEKYEQVLLVTGGGNGAQALNQLVIDNAAYLLRRYPELAILHISGANLAELTEASYDQALPEADRHRVIVEGFVADLYRYSGAADVVIARGGATNLAEFAVQGKACVIVPSPQLGWNVKNAQVMARHGAIIHLSEVQAEQERRLAGVVSELFDDKKRRAELAGRMHALGHPGSAAELADLLIECIESKSQQTSRDSE